MAKFVDKSNGAAIGDGYHAARFSAGSQTLEIMTDTKAGTYSEVILLADVIVPPPPPPPPPVEAGAYDAAGLTAALNAARGGEVIRLASGFYGDFSFAGKVFDGPVQLVSISPATPATFRSITLTRVTGLVLDRLSVNYTPDAATKDTSAGINCNTVTGLMITGCTIKGGPAVTDGLLIGRGIYVTDGKDITISDCDISGFRRGIQTPKTDGLKVLRNYIHDLRTTPIGGGVVSNVLVQGNHLEGSKPNNFGGAGDHGDFIHFWTQPSQIGPNRNIVIRDNFIEQGDGTAILGIYLDNNVNPQGFADVLIENNIIHNGNGQGLRLEDVVRGVVRKNTLLQVEGTYANAPRIRIEDGCRDIVIDNNIVANTTTGDAAAAAPAGRPAAVVAAETAALRAANNISEVGTVIVQYDKPGAANYQGDLFVGLPKKNGTIDDMQKRPGMLPGVGADLLPHMITSA